MAIKLAVGALVLKLRRQRNAPGVSAGAAVGVFSDGGERAGVGGRLADGERAVRLVQATATGGTARMRASAATKSACQAQRARR